MYKLVAAILLGNGVGGRMATAPITIALGYLSYTKCTKYVYIETHFQHVKKKKWSSSCDVFVCRHA